MEIRQVYQKMICIKLLKPCIRKCKLQVVFSCCTFILFLFAKTQTRVMEKGRYEAYEQRNGYVPLSKEAANVKWAI